MTPPGEPAGIPTATVCRGARCQARIRFVPATVTRKLMVLDADPSPRGTVYLHDGYGEVRAQVLGKDAAKAFRSGRIPLYRDHHADCPDVKAFRR